MAKPNAPRGPTPKARAGLYAMAAFYLAYLFWQLAKPLLTGAPDAPPPLALGLGTVILGGGAVFLALLAWRLYKTPPESEEDDVSGEEEP